MKRDKMTLPSTIPVPGPHVRYKEKAVSKCHSKPRGRLQTDLQRQRTRAAICIQSFCRAAMAREEVRRKVERMIVGLLKEEPWLQSLDIVESELLPVGKSNDSNVERSYRVLTDIYDQEQYIEETKESPDIQGIEIVFSNYSVDRGSSVVTDDDVSELLDTAHSSADEQDFPHDETEEAGQESVSPQHFYKRQPIRIKSKRSYKNVQKRNTAASRVPTRIRRMQVGSIRPRICKVWTKAKLKRALIDRKRIKSQKDAKGNQTYALLLLRIRIHNSKIRPNVYKKMELFQRPSR